MAPRAAETRRAQRATSRSSLCFLAIRHLIFFYHEEELLWHYFSNFPSLFSCIAATMTTIWRPHPLNEHVKPVEEEVPDDDVPDVKVEPVADDDGINGED